MRLPLPLLLFSWASAHRTAHAVQFDGSFEHEAASLSSTNTEADPSAEPPSVDGLERLLELAEQGNRDAASNLGYIYSSATEPLGAPKNDSASAYWYGRAALLNHTVSQANYALLLLNGTGLAKNVTKGGSHMRDGQLSVIVLAERTVPTSKTTSKDKLTQILSILQTCRFLRHSRPP